MVDFNNVKVHIGNKPINVVSSTEFIDDKVTSSNVWKHDDAWINDRINIVSWSTSARLDKIINCLSDTRHERYEIRKYFRLLHSKKSRYRKWCKRFLDRTY